MSSKFSILHISDLHRITEANADCLRASFEVEKEYYRTHDIPYPSFIVVSGDIINGTKEEDALKAKAIIQKQYQEAGKFLSDLCDIFFDGHRERLIMVPGNHDVSQYVSRASMTKIDHDNLKPLVEELWNQDSSIRWNWQDLHFYKISNSDIYNHRFNDFADFYNEFYKDLRLPERSFSEKPNDQTTIVDFSNENVTFVCFNSCYLLDHLNPSGSISFSSLSRLSKELLPLKRQGRLMIGVWHHHTQGLPKENNYLDFHILDNMSRYGIKMGLHGHQHVGRILNEYRDVFTKDKFWLLSAGTVYGNQSDIVPTTSRQFNLIILEREIKDCKITLYSREDKSPQSPEPVWETGLIGKSQYTEFSFMIETEPISTPDQDMQLNEEINKINMEVEKTRNYHLASQRLMSLDINNIVVRKFLLEYLSRAADLGTIIEVFCEPHNSAEAVSFIDSCIKTKSKDAFDSFKNSRYAQNIEDASVKAIFEEANFILRK